jgi:hypothetical protein
MFDRAKAKLNDVATRWWDSSLRSEKTLDRLHRMLDDMSSVKERSEQALDDVYAAWRVPSSGDLERVGERVTAMQRQLDRIEGLLESQRTVTSA